MKIDLRKISNKGITEGQQYVLEELFAKRGIEFQTIEDGYTVSGYTEMGREYSDTIGKSELKSYLSDIMKMDKLTAKVNRIRAKEGVTSYETISKEHLFSKVSNKYKNVKGISNYIKTLERILEIDPKKGVNRIVGASLRQRELEELKYYSFEDHYNMSKKLMPGVNVGSYMDKNGNFKSEKKKKKFIKMFSEKIIDNFEEYKEEGDGQSFFKWFKGSFDKEYQEKYKNMTMKERQELYGEYTRETIKGKIRTIEEEGTEDFHYRIEELEIIAKGVKRKENE